MVVVVGAVVVDDIVDGNVVVVVGVVIVVDVVGVGLVELQVGSSG